MTGKARRRPQKACRKAQEGGGQWEGIRQQWQLLEAVDPEERRLAEQRALALVQHGYGAVRWPEP